MYVIIVGLSRIGQRLANQLIKEKHDVVVVEKDEEKAKKVAESLDALVINGSGTELEVLTQAGAEKANAIIACTSDDAVNLMVCELARILGIKRMITLSSNPKHEKIFQEIGVEHIVYPNTTIANYLKNLILRPGISSVLTTIKDADIVELAVPENSKVVGKALKDITIPDGSTVAAIYRNEQLIIPRGGTTIFGGDKLTILAKVEVINKLSEILRSQE